MSTSAGFYESFRSRNQIRPSGLISKKNFERESVLLQRALYAALQPFPSLSKLSPTGLRPTVVVASPSSAATSSPVQVAVNLSRRWRTLYLDFLAAAVKAGIVIISNALGAEDDLQLIAARNRATTTTRTTWPKTKESIVWRTTVVASKPACFADMKK